MDQRRCSFLLFGSTLVVKIKKRQESTPSILKRITEDKENTILLPVVSPLSLNPGLSCLLQQAETQSAADLSDLFILVF